MVVVKTLRGSYPRREDSTCRKLRNNKPNPTSSTMPSATWPATRQFRRRRECKPTPAFGAVSFKLSLRFTRVTCSAGIIPKVKALRSDTAKLTMRTRAFTCRYAPESISDATLVMISSHHRVAMSATTPPKRKSNVLSVKSCRIIRPREEPSAARTAISLWRFTPRARSRLATFAHATKSTTLDAAAVIHKPC
jgi:hypothetical protein